MPSYPVCTVIAEKFEAMIRLDEQNTRMKDFFDLDLLLRTDTPERELLRNAIRATFERRGSEIPASTPTGLTERFASEKQVMWNAFLRKNGLEAVKFPEVVAAIRGKLEWIWEGRSNGLRKG